MLSENTGVTANVTFTRSPVIRLFQVRVSKQEHFVQRKEEPTNCKMVNVASSSIRTSQSSVVTQDLLIARGRKGPRLETQPQEVARM